MANMSYCRFQNTLGDLRDFLENINDEDLSVEEQRARCGLVEVCREIVAASDEQEDREYLYYRGGDKK